MVADEPTSRAEVGQEAERFTELDDNANQTTPADTPIAIMNHAFVVPGRRRLGNAGRKRVKMTANPELKIVKPSFSEKFKSKNTPTISGVQTLLTALPILKIGEVDDWTRLHPTEDEYWTCELCFVSVPIQGRQARHAARDR